MRVLVLGCGLQGRAAVADLAAGGVDLLVCADADPGRARAEIEAVGAPGVEVVGLDATDPAALASVVGGGFDVVVDLLPRQLARPVALAAVAAGVHLVNTYYDWALRDLDGPAAGAGVAILPEMGLDPGIDLVMAAEACRRVGTVTRLISYGGGIPEWAAADNPLRYRISWTFEGVLDSYARPARLMVDGEVVDLPPGRIFDPGSIHQIDIEPLGTLEAFPNGDAVGYLERLGITSTVTDAGRYALRWPGHAAVWRALAGLGFLDDDPLPDGRSPRRFLVDHLEPRLQYGPGQRDVVVIRVDAAGRGGEAERVVLQMVDRRDLGTGLMAMNRTVGFPAAIAARMLAEGAIGGRGLLSPIRDVPYGPLTAELHRRGIVIEEVA